MTANLTCHFFNFGWISPEPSMRERISQLTATIYLDSIDAIRRCMSAKDVRRSDHALLVLSPIDRISRDLIGCILPPWPSGNDATIGAVDRHELVRSIDRHLPKIAAVLKGFDAGPVVVIMAGFAAIYPLPAPDWTSANVAFDFESGSAHAG
jgi:hypothetical protein